MFATAYMYDSGNIVVIQGELTNDTPRYSMSVQEMKHGVNVVDGCLTHIG